MQTKTETEKDIEILVTEKVCHAALYREMPLYSWGLIGDPVANKLIEKLNYSSLRLKFRYHFQAWTEVGLEWRFQVDKVAHTELGI